MNELAKGHWGEINHFVRKELDDPRHPGSGDLIALKVVKALDRARRRLGAPIMIHKASKGGVAFDGHSKHSYHYPRLADPSFPKRAIYPPQDAPVQWDQLEVLGPGRAVDLHVGHRKVNGRHTPVPYGEQMAVFWLVGFRGIGLYPGWKPCPGWHLDVRDDPLLWIGLDIPTTAPGVTKREYVYLTA